ncbi:type IV secretion system protein [Thioalkalivibrio sp. ALE16]|uniref:type IV secretion system protein n=1 Tax=Thioalkalivibrio sp. ALE16 TaxID=1158172 RepID=UPI00036BBE4F|nr:type IV secretion system protein [Thioalkalivibrio sp. ALE16]
MAAPVGQLINDGLDAVVGPVMGLTILATEAGQNLSAVALTIMDFLIVIIIVWFGIRMALSSSMDASDYVFNLVKMIILWSIFYWIVGNYGELVEYFYNGFDRLSSTVEQETVSAIATQAGLSQAQAGSANVAEIDSDLPGSNAIRGLGHFMDMMGKSVRTAEDIINSEIADRSWREKPSAAIQGLWVIIKIHVIHAIAILASVAYLLIYAFMLILVTFMQTVVIAIGPIMLMTLMVPYLSFLGDGWVRMAILVGLMKIVLTIILSVFGGLLLSVTANMDSFDQFAPGPEPECEVGPEMPNRGGGGYTRCEDPEENLTGINQLNGAFTLMTILPLILTAAVGGIMLLKAPLLAEMLMMGRGFGMATSAGAGMAAKGGARAAPAVAAAGSRGAAAVARAVGKNR